MIPLGRASLAPLRGRGPVTFFLDLDGTLAPFVPDPAAARLTPAARAAVRTLRRNGHPVILVTGRRARDAARVAGRDFDAILGGHGAERLDARGARPWLGTREGRRAIARAARILGRDGTLTGCRLEEKGWSLAIHLPRGGAAVLARRIRARLARLPVVVRAGRRVVDVRARGVDKGRAVRRWLGRTNGPVLYAGDDATDQDAFAALRGRAMTVVVGRHATGAAFRSSGPAAFGRWLLRVAGELG